MSTDFSKPIVTDAYATLLPGVVQAHLDLARQLEPTLTGTSTNVPTGAVRWNASTIRWERYNGASWVTLPSAGDNVYAISISGNAATATTAAACSGNAATATTASACSGNAATATTASACSGNAATASNALGVGQTWQALGAGRAVGTTYTNSTGRSIQVSVICMHAAAYDDSGLWINGVRTSYFGCGAFPTPATHALIIPNGATYKMTSTSGSLNGGAWYELR